jgi:hypothetical protein
LEFNVSSIPLYVAADKNQLIGTNYWSSAPAQAGFYMLAHCKKALFLLCPKAKKSDIREMKTAKEVIISHGLWIEAGEMGIEVLFEDNTSRPFSLTLSTNNCITSLPTKGSCQFSVWSRRGREALRLPARYREVDQIPCRLPWGDQSVKSIAG